jgi:multisubunit Na+/H+ antiporter MnhE subunit
MTRQYFYQLLWTWISLAGLLTLLWLILTQASFDLLGLIIIAGVSSLAVLLGWPALSLSVLGRMPRFLAYYLPQMFWGAMNVAKLACLPNIRFQPQWQQYQPSVATQQHPLALLLLSSCICLIPGTLAMVDKAETLHVHVLDHRAAWLSQVQQLEHEILRLLLGRSA